MSASSHQPLDNYTLLLQRAEKAANEQLTIWIRCALREVALQSLHQSLKVTTTITTTKTTESAAAEEEEEEEEAQQQNPNSKSSTNNNVNAEDEDSNKKKDITIVVGPIQILELSDHAIAAAQRLCRKVATAWCNQLVSLGHFQVIALVENIVETECETLFYTNTNNNNSSHTTTTASTKTKNATEKQPFSASAESPASISSNDFVTTHGRLRAIGRRCRDDVLAPTIKQQQQLDEESCIIQEALQQLDDLAAKGLTEAWPYPWELIQKKAHEIPSRLHNSSNNSNIIINTSKQQLQEQEELEEEAILHRKRKNRTNRVPTSSLPSPLKQRKTRGCGCDSSSSSRPPNDQASHQQWRWDDVVQSLTVSDREMLDRCYLQQHENNKDDKDATPPASVLLGALVDTGRFHHWNQRGELGVDKHGRDSNNGRRTITSQAALSDRQKCTAMRKSFRERLGTHDSNNNNNNRGSIGGYAFGKGGGVLPRATAKAKAAPLSRVTHAIQNVGGSGINDNDHHASSSSPGENEHEEEQQQHWLHFDLNHCLLEWNTTSSGQQEANNNRNGGEVPERKLYYFDSLEAMLLDEDKDDEGLHSQPSL